MNLKPVDYESSDLPFAVLLKIVGRGIFGSQRRGTGWLLADRGGLFVITAAHNFAKSANEGDTLHIFAGAPEPYHGAHQRYRLRLSAVDDHRHENLESNALPTDGNENFASVSFIKEAEGNEQSSVPNDIAIVHLTGDNRQLLAGTRPLALHQLSTNTSILATSTRLRLFGCASPPIAQDTNYYIIDPEECMFSSNETKGFCFRCKFGWDQPVKGDSGAAIICPDNATEEGDPQVCGMLFARTNTKAGLALSMAHYGPFIQKIIERVL
uniref:Peptidase S1 domain-containing protein n=1 Tax=Plectus sambesii TaxID=2011161 RepID=A0A914V1S8_9BILA